MITISYYTQKNVTEKFNNNQYKIDIPGDKDIYVKIPDGFYTVESLSSYFEYILEKNKLDKDTVVLISNRTKKQNNN